jgi:hypothetical protein
MMMMRTNFLRAARMARQYSVATAKCEGAAGYGY